MLAVQKYLMTIDVAGNKNPLECLEKDYAIKATHSPIGEPLVILNYCQIDSPKNAPITRECRGLVLDTTDWSVVAKPFSRFYNYGENREEINKFNWNDFCVEEKHDGSLIVLYNYRGTWRVNTRGSFGLGKVGESNFTWEELFYQTIRESALDDIHEDCTLVFELCSIYNKVVRTYNTPESYLLAMFNRKTCEEFLRSAGKARCQVKTFANMLGCSVSPHYEFGNVDDILKWLEKDSLEPTFEGFVIRDNTGRRMKIKNKNYLRLHRMRDNNNLFAGKNLVPFLLKNETDELLAIYPEVKNHLDVYKNLLDENLKLIESTYSKIWNRNTQKSFAIKVMEMCPKWQSILFRCRKENKQPLEIWRESEDLILKTLDNELTKLYSNTVPSTPEKTNVQ
jgi:RNA ligase